MKVMVVFGTRPEAIKMCPVIKELELHKEIKTLVCITGQHREMLQQVLDVFGVKPDYNLDIMEQRQTLFDVTTSIITKIKAVLEQERPDIVLVHGDTTTTFATALSCFYLQIPVGPVEAGLRTGNLYSPYPEEFNRKCVSIIAALNFAPTELSRQNLIREGYAESSIYITGNTAIDALATTVNHLYRNRILDWAKGSRLILVTAHRRENLGAPLKSMLRAISRIIEEFPDTKAVYPVHLNPAVREVANEVLGQNERIQLIEPLNVLDFHNFMAQSYLILTDSGGIQEEAPSLGKPVLVMRDVTERPEGVAAGTLKIVGTTEENIYQETKRLLEDPIEHKRMSEAKNPYGDGHASQRIVDVVCGYLTEKDNVNRWR